MYALKFTTHKLYTDTIYPNNKFTQIYTINKLTKHNYSSAAGSPPPTVPLGTLVPA